MTLCSKHKLSCLADLLALLVKRALSATPEEEIWTGMLSLSEKLHEGDRWMKGWTNVCSFVGPSVPHTHYRRHSWSGFDKSGSNDASQHRTLAFPVYVDNVTTNTIKAYLWSEEEMPDSFHSKYSSQVTDCFEALVLKCFYFMLYTSLYIRGKCFIHNI